MINYILFDAADKKVRLRSSKDANQFWLTALKTLLVPKRAQHLMEMHGASHVTDIYRSLVETYGEDRILTIFNGSDYIMVFPADPKLASTQNNVIGLWVGQHSEAGSVIIVGGTADKVKSLDEQDEDFILQRFKAGKIHF